MVSFKKLFLSFLLSAAFVAPVCSATNSVAEESETQSNEENQLKNYLHTIIKTNGLVSPSSFQWNNSESNFKYTAKFIKVPNNLNIGEHALQQILDYYTNKNISAATLKEGAYYSSYFQEEGATYLIYKNDYLIYARVMKDPKKPILFIKATSNWDQEEYYLKWWGEQSDESFLGFSYNFFVYDRTLKLNQVPQ